MPFVVAAVALRSSRRCTGEKVCPVLMMSRIYWAIVVNVLGCETAEARVEKRRVDRTGSCKRAMPYVPYSWCPRFFIVLKLSNASEP